MLFKLSCNLLQKDWTICLTPSIVSVIEHVCNFQGVETIVKIVSSPIRNIIQTPFKYLLYLYNYMS